MSHQSPEQYLQKLEQTVEHTKSQIAAAHSLMKKQNKQQDVQRKIALGGFMLEHASKSSRARESVQRIIDQLTKSQEIKAFDNWELPPIKKKRSDELDE